jgi:paraquat-inducible protein A
MRVGCLQCDLLVNLPELKPGERATCPRCGFLLTVKIKDGISRALAFAVTALVFLGLANFSPFLSFNAAGSGHTMTLLQASQSLYQEGFRGLAVLVFGFIVLVPGAMLTTLIVLLGPVYLNRPQPYLALLGRIIYRLSPWSMAEVFIIGVIVSLVKMEGMATVVLGISFWEYVGFTLCFTAAAASLDRLEVWTAIERLSR